MNFIVRLRSFGARTALVEASGSAITYAELAARAEALATAFGSTRQLVAIDCANSIEAIVGYVAVLAGGHAGILVPQSMQGAGGGPLLERYGVTRRWGWDAGRGAYAIDNLGVAAPELHPSLALMLTTSGSTGSLKLVRLSMRNLDSNASSIATLLGLSETERPITTLPMHYSYGLSVINSHLSVGATILLTEQPVTSREFWDFFKTREATSFAGVPFTYHVLRRLRFERMELPSLRMFTQAGGRLESEHVKYFATLAQRHGRRFFVMYGQTEATARISYLPPELAEAYPASIGIAIPGGELQLRDEEARPVESVDAMGELIYTGPNVMMGYAQSLADLRDGDICRGTIATGDLAVRNEQGLFFIRGRKSRFIKLFGNRVALDEVEAILSTQGHVCGVTGEDDALRIATEGGRVAAEAVGELLRERFNFHPTAFKVLCVSALPRNAAGKIAYPELTKLFDDDACAGIVKTEGARL